MATIVIADDVALVRETIAFALGKAGHRTHVAADGIDAIRAVRAHGADLLILDLKMPGLDGIEALRSLRADPKFQHLPVLVLTDASDKDTVVRAMNLSANQYLLKSSFSVQDLLGRIATLVRPPASDVAAPVVGSAADATVRRADTASAAQTMRIHRPARALKDIKPVITRSEFMARIDSYGELTGISAVAAEVLNLSRRPESSPDDLARAVRRDPALAARLLKLANSAAYARGVPVTSIDRAVMVIGMQTIGQVVMGISVMDGLCGAPNDAIIDMPSFWEHSIACGLIAAKIARLTGRCDADAAFSIGLLHDVGRLILAKAFPEEMAAVLTAATELHLPLHTVESRMLLMNHAEASERLLHAWNIPRSLAEPIALHHIDTGDMKARRRTRESSLEVLILADRLAHAMLLGPGRGDMIQPIRDLCVTLKLDVAAVQSIVGDIPDQVDDLKVAMAAQGGQVWPSRLDVLRGQLGCQARPIYVTSSKAPDAMDLCLQRLAGDWQEPPTVVVLSMAGSGDTSRVAEQVAKAESDAGVTQLPMLILSPAEYADAALEVAGKRIAQVLPTPTPLTSLLSALMSLASNTSDQAPRGHVRMS